MADFDPGKFEEKYVHYLQELEQAYRGAFEGMNEQYDSDLVHAIDQQVLNESEPFYEGDGEFRIDLPDDPVDRIEGVLAPKEKVEETLSEYVAALEDELRRVFGFE